MLIAKRIRQLQHGAHARVQRQEEESYFSVAVREIAEGLLTLDEHAETVETQNNSSPADAPAASAIPPEV
jgi:DNA-directed RNA polymerase subunit K/omega